MKQRASMMIVKILNRKSSSLRSVRQRNFILITGCIAFSASILYLFDPATSGLYPSSPFRVLTGFLCPGCGTLRGLHQLLNGNLGTAFGLNPLMILSLPYLMYTYVCYALPAFTGRQIEPLFTPSARTWWVLIIVILYWILRNIPYAPFVWLAP